MQRQAIIFVFSHFPLVMCILAIIIAALNPYNFNRRLLVTMFVLAVGLTGIWGFIMHGFFADIAAQNIGWLPSPFQAEVALANLAFGLGGLTAAFASRAYQFAVTLMTTTFLWGAAGYHIKQIIILHNFNPGNAGSILWIDILIPLLLIILLILDRSSKAKNPIYY